MEKKINNHTDDNSCFCPQPCRSDLCAYAEMEGLMWKVSLGTLALRACLNSSSISKPGYGLQWCLQLTKFSILPPTYDPSFYNAAYEESLHVQPSSCHPNSMLEKVCPLPPLLWQHRRDRAERQWSHLQPTCSIYASDLTFLDKGSWESCLYFVHTIR